MTSRCSAAPFTADAICCRSGSYMDGVAVAAITATPNVVDVVVFDDVVVGGGGSVAPGPADGNAGVVEVADFVVGDRVVRALADPDADGTGEDPSAASDDVVVDCDVAGVLRFGGGDGRARD